MTLAFIYIGLELLAVHWSRNNQEIAGKPGLELRIEV